jgi:hypothetical protein
MIGIPTPCCWVELVKYSNSVDLAELLVYGRGMWRVSSDDPSGILLRNPLQSLVACPGINSKL